MWHPILIKQSNTRANSNTNTKLWDMCAIVHRSNLTLWSWWGKELSQGGGFPYFQHQGRYNSTHSLKKSSLCRLSLTNPFSSSPFNVFTVQYAMTFWQKTPQIHKYTNTRIHKYANTRIHKYTNTIHIYCFSFTLGFPPQNPWNVQFDDFIIQAIIVERKSFISLESKPGRLHKVHTCTSL